MDILKWSTKKTEVHTGKSYIFSIQIHSKKWMQAGVVNLFYDFKKKWFTAEKVE